MRQTTSHASILNPSDWSDKHMHTVVQWDDKLFIGRYQGQYRKKKNGEIVPHGIGLFFGTHIPILPGFKLDLFK